MTERTTERRPWHKNLARRARVAFRRAKSWCLRRRYARIVWLLGARLLDGEVAQSASAMAFDLFLATIPMLALGGWAFGRLLHQNTEAQVAVSALLDLTPSEVRDLVWTQIQHFGIGAVAPLVLLGALWMASSAFHTSMNMLEMAASAPPRPWLRKRLLSLGWVLCTIGLFGAGAGLAVEIAGGPAHLLERLALGGAGAVARVTHAVLLVTMLLVGMLLLAAFYRTAVYRGAPRRVWPGVVITCLGGAVISAAFAYYVQHLSRFAVFYGSLAAVAIVLGWLFLLCFAFLAGAELNAVLDQEATLADGHHQRRLHAPWSVPGEPNGDDQRAAEASGSGERHTPQPSGSSAEA